VLEDLQGVDLFVHDDLYGDLGGSLAWLKGLGVETRIVARGSIAGDRGATLVRIVSLSRSPR
jgi:hypothetical protein